MTLVMNQCSSASLNLAHYGSIKRAFFITDFSHICCSFCMLCSFSKMVLTN